MTDVEQGPGYVGISMSGNDEAAQLAAENGCQPFYWEPYKGYCCGCDDYLHCCDQQCSYISMKSAARKRTS